MMAVRPLAKYLLLLAFGIICSIAICKASPVTTNSIHAAQPCWLDNPMTKGKGGQIGIARSISASSQSPEDVSRLRALKRLCASRGIQCDEDLLRSSLSDEILIGKRLYFSSFPYQDLVTK